MTRSLLANTPMITATDSRGRAVRELSYYRHPSTPEKTVTLINRHRYTPHGFLKQSCDPRLHDADLFNFDWITELTGSPLRSQSADAGITLTLDDVASRALLKVTGIGTDEHAGNDMSSSATSTWRYENGALPGRLLSVTEQKPEDTAWIAERLVYADNSQPKKELNLAGQCVEHYDPAGLLQTNSIALNGAVHTVTRHLLKEVPTAGYADHWLSDHAAGLSIQHSNAYTTLTTTDAIRTPLATTDAAGNLQRMAYSVNGLLKGSWLKLKGGQEQVIVKSLTYSASGQKLREEHGNGVLTTWSYEPETQRLTGIRTERPAGHACGAKPLQDLRYAYDPVGNVITVRNDAEESRFWRGQKVVPENTYTYDSLYQLVKATGRERANAGQPSSLLPHLSLFDDVTYACYTRTYTYDSSGNLTQLRHCAPATGNGYTRSITVSNRSNRAVMSTLAARPSDVEALFTTGGHQKTLQAGQQLFWTVRGELLKVSPVTCRGEPADSEVYRYDAENQRVLKVSMLKATHNIQTRQVVYLPALELRTTSAIGTETEELQVIMMAEHGQAHIRMLHWRDDKPSNTDNDQLRYSYGDLTGNRGLEVNGEGNIVSQEEYYPYGGTAIMAAHSQTEVRYKTLRYSGKERDASGLYYYGYRYYQPCAGRWLSPDPATTSDGLNLYRMARSNPVTLWDPDGRLPVGSEANIETFEETSKTYQEAAQENRITFLQAKGMQAVRDYWPDPKHLGYSHEQSAHILDYRSTIRRNIASLPPMGSSPSLEQLRRTHTAHIHAASTTNTAPPSGAIMYHGGEILAGVTNYLAGQKVATDIFGPASKTFNDPIGSHGKDNRDSLSAALVNIGSAMTVNPIKRIKPAGLALTLAGKAMDADNMTTEIQYKTLKKSSTFTNFRSPPPSPVLLSRSTSLTNLLLGETLAIDATRSPTERKAFFNPKFIKH